MAALDYEITVTGLVPATVLAEFECVDVVVHPTVTVLRGPVIDQSALHGILDRLQGMDLELVAVQQVPADRGHR